MDRNLALEFVRITEAAALASARWMGRGDEKAADQAAVDIVLDPLEGTTICATGGVGATSVMALAQKGNFLHAPDTYMDKIACGPGARGSIDIDASPEDNIKNVAKALGKEISDMTVVILHRPRHEELISRVRKTGVRIHLIGDGDVSAAVATGQPSSGIDLLLGIGGAPEGVISAAALTCMGGDFQGRLKFRSDDERKRADKMGMKSLDQALRREDLCKGDVMFVATGVTTGPLLKGVQFLPGHRASTHSIVMRSATGTIRTIEAEHCLERKPSWRN